MVCSGVCSHSYTTGQTQSYSQLEDIISVFYKLSWQHFLQRNLNQSVNYPKMVDKKKQSLSEKRYNVREDLWRELLWCDSKNKCPERKEPRRFTGGRRDSLLQLAQAVFTSVQHHTHLLHLHTVHICLSLGIEYTQTAVCGSWGMLWRTNPP